MRSFSRLILIFAAWFGLVSASSAAPRPDTVILVSIDGFRADHLSHGRTPVIAALAAQGVRATMRPS